MNYSHNFVDFEYFCPACNLTFESFYDYQSHMILKEQQRPYREEIRETVKFMKEVIEQVPYKTETSKESLPSDLIQNRGRKSTLVRPKSRCRSKFIYLVCYKDVAARRLVKVKVDTSIYRLSDIKNTLLFLN